MPARRWQDALKHSTAPFVATREAAMGTEIELKLVGSPRALQQAVRLPWLRSSRSGPVSQRKIVSVYFDTPKFKLHQHGLSLRIRRIGRASGCRPSSPANGAMSCGEWEEEVSTEQPDLKRAKGTALAPLATRKLSGRCGPYSRPMCDAPSCRCASAAARSSPRPIGGKIKTGTRRAQVSEIELEDLAWPARRPCAPRRAGRRSDPGPIRSRARSRSARLCAAGRSRARTGRAAPIALLDGC